MNALPDPALLDDATPPPAAARHFIAINHHRFHDTSLIVPAIRSVLHAAARFRTACPDQEVRIVLFHQSAGLDQPCMDRLRALAGLEIVEQPPVSNGAGLNAQLDMAEAAGALWFYRADADDPVSPDRFLRQARLLHSSGADVVGGGLIYNNLSTGERFDMVPPSRPGPLDFLTNRALFHSTLAFRLDRLHAAGIRYWSRRLEDKQLALQIARAGLHVVNDSALYGAYNLNPKARSGLGPARLNLSLNLSMAWQSHRPDLVPLALGLFCASALLPSQTLRRLRHRLRRA